MSWRLLAEVRDRDLNAVAKLCAEAKPKALPFNTVHGKLLMLLLAEWCNDDGLAVYERSKSAFACASQMSGRQVQRLFAGFLHAGLIEIDRPADAQSKSPRLYRINIDRLAELPLTEIAKTDRARRERKRQRTGDQQTGTGDQQSPQRDPDGHGRGDQQSGRGDQQSGRGDQQSPTTPITPKETLTPTAREPEGKSTSPALESEVLSSLMERMPEDGARRCLRDWCSHLGSDLALSRMQRILREGPTAVGFNERMLGKDAGPSLGATEAV